MDFALGEFVNMMGSDARRHFLKGHMSDWASNPLTLGAYGAARLGRFASRAVMAQPLGDRVFFAGEAVVRRYEALVSGAHLSGDAVASEVVEIIGAEDCSACDARAAQRQRMLLEVLE